MVAATIIGRSAAQRPSGATGAGVRGCGESGGVGFQNRSGGNRTAAVCDEHAGESDSVRLHEPDSQYAAVGEGVLQRCRDAVVNGDELSRPHVVVAMLE